MASIGSNLLRNKDTQKRNNLLVSLKILAEGINEHEGATATEMAQLKKDLNRLISESNVSELERTKAMEIYKFMIRDDIEECLLLWFGKSEDTDATIKDQFGSEVITASLGAFEHWSYCAECPEMAVSLILLLDQFRRNLYRGTRAMYSCDKMCLKYVKRSMHEQIYTVLEPKAKIFFLLVLTHSEDLEDQMLCVNEFKKLQQDLDEDDPLHIFEQIFGRHLTTIEKFGRFPHRNGILKRKSTKDEEEFLADSSFRFDLPVVKTKDGFVFFRDGKTLWKMAFTKLREKSGNKQTGEEGTESDNNTETMINSQEGEDEIQIFFPSNFYENDPFAHQAAIEQQHSLKIGDIAPNFTANTTSGLLNFHEYMEGKWSVLFSYPKNAAMVSSRELARLVELKAEFEKRNCCLIGISTGSIEEQQKTVEFVNQEFKKKVHFPLVEDKMRKVSYRYGMLDQVYFDVKEGGNISITNRSLFIISPQKKISMMLQYPVGVGRNFSEILRILDALRLGEKLGPIATPPGWKPGEPAEPLPLVLIDNPLKTLTLSEELKYFL